ncbi:MAG TPA: hypothetical protein VK468_06450 [Pyrinomonadaceae bacterium]|nr:hypothetical protein [Pyrinomonadaceae bacterium]
MKKLSLVCGTIVSIAIGTSLVWGQSKPYLSPQQEAHAQMVIRSLNKSHPMRDSLEKGNRGDGVRRPYMEQMKKLGIKQASHTINFVWDPKGIKIFIDQRNYFSQYVVVDNPQTDSERFSRLVSSHLKGQLDKEAVTRARASMLGIFENRQRIYGLRPSKTCGTIQINLMDDETLPSFNPPAYLYEQDPKPAWCN